MKSGLLDQATQERLISGESDALEGFEFSDDAVLDALKALKMKTGPKDLISILMIARIRSSKSKP